MSGPWVREVCGIRLVATLETAAPPFWPEATVHEEDTYLCLGDYHGVSEPRESYPALVRRMESYVPRRPGSVVVQGHYPLRLLAIVHDVEREPTWRAEWVREALDGIFLMTARRGLRSLALPPLGCRHGRLGLPAFFALLFPSLARAAPPFPDRIWLPMAGATDCRALQEAPP